MPEGIDSRWLRQLEQRGEKGSICEWPNMECIYMRKMNRYISPRVGCYLEKCLIIWI